MRTPKDAQIADDGMSDANDHDMPFTLAVCARSSLMDITELNIEYDKM